MDIIGAVIKSGECLLWEADYLLFVMDLRARAGGDSSSLRPGLETISEANADRFCKFASQFSLDEDEIAADYLSIPPDERQESLVDFLPTVVIDFDRQEFRCSHPESVYLNFESYVSPGWKYVESSDVHASLPLDAPYWGSWT